MASYTVEWSPWGLMDRWIISRRVPSESGLFQLWVKDRSGIVLLTTEAAYYGGIRHTLRETIDELAPAGKRLRDLIDGRECWFRFSVSPSKKYLRELLSWFRERKSDIEENEILVFEKESESKFTNPPEDLVSSGRKRMRDADFGPKLPEPARRK